MLTLIATTLLTMTAVKADAVENARKAFNNCMIETHNTAVEGKASPSAFVATTEAACVTQRAAYHGTLVKAERSYGSTAKDAEQYATEEVQSLVDNVVGAFNVNVQNGALLVSEK